WHERHGDRRPLLGRGLGAEELHDRTRVGAHGSASCSPRDAVSSSGAHSRIGKTSPPSGYRGQSVWNRQKKQSARELGTYRPARSSSRTRWMRPDRRARIRALYSSSPVVTSQTCVTSSPTRFLPGRKASSTASTGRKGARSSHSPTAR